MLPRRTTPEVRTGHQHRCIPIPRPIEDEVPSLPQVVEEKRAEAGLLDPLEELLGNDLVGVDVHPVEGGENAGDAGKRFHSVEFPNIHEMTGDGGRGSHRRADQVRPPTTALPSLEVTVAGRSAAFARSENVGIHAEAHRASSIAPLEASLAKQSIETFGLGLPLYARRARYDHGAHLWMYPVTADY